MSTVKFDRDGTPADADEISEMIKQEIINEASDVPKKKLNEQVVVLPTC